MNEPTLDKSNVILLARDTDSTWMILNYMEPHIPISSVLIEQPISRWTLVNNRAKRIGWMKAIGQVFFISVISPLINLLSGKRKNELYKKYNIDIRKPAGEKIINLESVNSEQCRDWLRRLNPDLVIVNGTRIICDKTLQSINAPFINIHDGITPAFRGVHGGYWALASGKPELFGTTIHLVDKGVDTGGILEQIFIQPSPEDNFATYPILQHAIALPVLLEVVRKILSGEKIEPRQPVCENLPLHYHPTIWEWMKNRKRTLSMFFLVESIACFV